MSEFKSASKSSIEPWVFVPPFVAVIALVAWVVNSPATAGAILSKFAFGTICFEWGWFFQWYIFAIVVICIFLCLHPIGKKRFGNDKPDFSTFSWLGMIFTAVAGFGVLTWTSIEWFYYYQTPTWGIDPYSLEALYMSTAYPLHHWGFIIFSAATLMGVLYAYQIYCKKVKDVRPSTACIAAIGEKNAVGWMGKTIDAFFAISVMTGLVTAVGVNAPTLFGTISRVIGAQPTFAAQAFVIVLWSVVMALLLYTGLSKGLRYLSDFRVIAGFGILLFLLFVGPTSYLLNGMVDNVGMYLQNFMRLTLNTDTYAASGTPQNWTVFYWCWYLALAIQTGIFFAKISKGRTVRELIVGALLAQTIGSWIFFGIFMNYSIYIFQTEAVDIAGIIATSGQGEAIVSLWDHIPFSGFLFPVLMIYGFFSMQTLLNGNVYSMAMITTKTMGANEEPPRWNRVFWSLGIGAIAISLLLVGGIAASQSITIIGSIPAVIIMTLMCWAFYKEIHKAWIIRKENGEIDTVEGYVIKEIYEEVHEFSPEREAESKAALEPKPTIGTS